MPEEDNLCVDLIQDWQTSFQGSACQLFDFLFCSAGFRFHTTAILRRLPRQILGSAQVYARLRVFFRGSEKQFDETQNYSSSTTRSVEQYSNTIEPSALSQMSIVINQGSLDTGILAYLTYLPD